MDNLLSELDRVALTEDLPEKGLSTGDEGAIMMVFREGAGGYTGPDGYSVEFATESGGRFPDYQVVNLAPGQVRLVEDAKAPARAAA